MRSSPQTPPNNMAKDSYRVHGSCTLSDNQGEVVARGGEIVELDLEAKAVQARFAGSLWMLTKVSTAAAEAEAARKAEHERGRAIFEARAAKADAELKAHLTQRAAAAVPDIEKGAPAAKARG